MNITIIVREGVLVVVKAVKRAKDARNNVPKDMKGIVTEVVNSDFGLRIQFVDDKVEQDISMDRWKHYHWVSADNLAVVNPEQYYLSPEDAWAEGCRVAWGIINQRTWKAITYVPTPGWATIL